MPPIKSETPHNGGASRNSCGGCFRDASRPSENSLQLPPIIALHLWQSNEMTALEALAAIAMIGRASHD